MIAIRWPPPLPEAIERYAQDQKLTRADALRQIVTKFLASEGMIDRRPRAASGSPMPAPRRLAPRSKFTTRDVRVGMKVRVMGLNKADTLSREIFTIVPFDPDEPRPGPDWFAIDEVRFVHVDDLRAAEARAASVGPAGKRKALADQKRVKRHAHNASR